MLELGADLFCGAGGLTEGIEAAAADLGIDLEVVAINHWEVAIETHRHNHPKAVQILASLAGGEDTAEQRTLFSLMDAIDPRKAGRMGPMRILAAAPECTHHSNARGGKPRSDQSRSSAWCILRWVEARKPLSVVIENVPEFLTWGPLGANGKPLKSRKGETFEAFANALVALNYRVEWRILNCADYGDATTRRRFFLRAERGRRDVRWPDATHAPAERAAEAGLLPWRAAREIIDWTIPGNSLFLTRAEARRHGVNRPLSPNTLRRIAVGIRKYWGEWAEPFLVMLYGTNNARGLDGPLPAITAKGQHIGLVRPFLVSYHGGPDADRRVHSIEMPLPVQETSNRYGLAQGMLIQQQSGGVARDVGQPVPTVATRSAIGLRDRFAVVEPGLVRDESSGDLYALDIRFRMLAPGELAAAHSFPPGYEFTGTREDQVKQIGNSVPVRTATALCRSALAG